MTAILIVPMLCSVVPMLHSSASTTKRKGERRPLAQTSHPNGYFRLHDGILVGNPVGGFLRCAAGVMMFRLDIAILLWSPRL
jgi:hypothetical protein